MERGVFLPRLRPTSLAGAKLFALKESSGEIMHKAGAAKYSGDVWARHMKAGRFESAWEISDMILRARSGNDSPHLPRHLQAIWNGASLKGRRVLVRCYHGLGDTIQFIRYIPPVRAVAREVIVWAQPELIPLLRGMAGIGTLLPLHDGTPDVGYDVDAEIMEFPHVFRTTLDTIPAETPYIHVKPAPVPGDGRMRVGLVWNSGDWDAGRSIPFSLIPPLEEVPDLAWHIFQRGPGLDERNDGFGIMAGSDDVLETARRVRTLDLMISVDTMVAHLAGALGTPVWTLLQADADWRWMEGREDSPWYPTMRLFRQEKKGDWKPVIVRIGQELKKIAGRKRFKGRSREIELTAGTGSVAPPPPTKTESARPPALRDPSCRRPAVSGSVTPG
jgi:hypothetical protein